MIVLAATIAAADVPTTGRPIVDPEQHPLTQVPKDRSTTERVLRFPAWLAERPFWLLGRGLEGSLTWVEQKNVIGTLGRFPAWLRDNHVILAPSSQGTGAGTGILAGTFAAGRRGLFMATTDWTVRGYQAHVLRARVPLSRSVGVLAEGGFDRRTRENFFGIGSTTHAHDRSQYRQDSLSGGVALELRGDGWVLRGEGDWADFEETEDPDADEHPSTRDVFPGLPGDSGATIVSGGVAFEHETRDSRVEAAVHVHDDADGSTYGFNRYALTLYKEIPVYRGDRVLAFRLHGVTTDPHSDRLVPFWLLPELSAAQGLRAYEARRFRDLDAVVMNVEYRFPIWDIGTASGAAIETVLFFDAGRVSPAIEDDLVWRELKSDAGIALRARTRAAMLARINAAFAADDWRLELVTGRDF